MPQYHLPEKDALASLDEFTQGYIECAFFCDANSDREESGFDHDGYGADDLAPETLAAMIKDCAEFQVTNAKLLAEAYTKTMETRNSCVCYGQEQAGHDFWYTRNGHGVGYWDRGLGSLGDDLSDACKTWPERSLYVADSDKKVYAE